MLTVYVYVCARACPPCPAGIQAYFAWLCYFYVAMALRECVLLVNGSHIRPWWISHHIWSAVGSLLMLSLPISSPSESCLFCACKDQLAPVWDGLRQNAFSSSVGHPLFVQFVGHSAAPSG